MISLQAEDSTEWVGGNGRDGKMKNIEHMLTC